MIQRPKIFRKADFMSISDKPVLSEIEQELAFSSPSNLMLMGDLHKVGIKQKDCVYTYLTYEKTDKTNFDFKDFFCKHKNLEPVEGGLGINGKRFIKSELEKDLYIEESFYKKLQELLLLIKEVEPKVIIITGKWSLFLLTACVSYTRTQSTYKITKPLGGLDKFRASILRLHESYGMQNIIVFPILPPTSRFKTPEKYPIMQWDLKKLGVIAKDVKLNNHKKYLERKRHFKCKQDYDFLVENLETLISEVEKKPTLVSVDIETRFYLIDCIGFSIEKNTGLCVAFSTLENPSIWTIDQETHIISLIKKLLTLPTCRIVGQNFSYDSQYLQKYWLLDVTSFIDTMILHHCLYNYMPKSLDFLASVYCDDYKYWKDMQKFSKLDG